MLMIIKKNLKTLKTCDLYLGIFSLGLCYSLTGPCLLDLQRIISTDTHHIALIYTSRSIGFLVGAIVGGIILDIARSKFCILTACNFFVAVTMFGIPWSRSVNTLLSLAVLNGISLGALETGANVVCIELRGSGPYLQALHFTYGLGGLISPLIAVPFLEYKNDIQTSIYNFSNIKNVFPNISSDSPMKEVPGVTYPFSIIGIICLLITILFFLTCLVSPAEDQDSSKDKKDNSDSSWFFLTAIVTFTFLVFFVMLGSEISFGQTLTTYAVKGSLQTTTTLGSYMTSAFWTAFTIMRFISIFLSMKVSNMTLLISDVLLAAVAGVLLLFFMPNEWALWAACVTFGAGVASAYPSLVGWLDNYIVITNKISAIFTVGCAAGEMVVPFIIAYFIEAIPEMFAYVTASTSILTAVLLLILYGIVKNGKNNSNSKQTESDSKNNEKVVNVITI